MGIHSFYEQEERLLSDIDPLFFVGYNAHMLANFNIDNTIFKKHEIKLAYLFGSHQKGTASNKSDIDIAILFNTTPQDPLALKGISSLSQDLGSFFSEKLDIICLNHAPLLLKYEVIAHNYLLYCTNEKERIEFEVRIMKEYIDEIPIRNLYNQTLYKRILQGA